MSSYAGLYLQGIEIFVWRNEVDPTFLYLFTSQDVRRSSRDPDEISEYEPGETVLLTASASVLRDRLDVLGIGQDITESALKEYAEDKAETLKNIRSSVGTVVQSRIDLLETITPTRWADLLTQAIKSPEKHGRTAGRDPTSVVSLLEIWEDADPRFLLSAVLLACEDDDELTLDVSELISGGWLDDQFDPQSVAIEHFSSSLANGNPPVVITEGSTDAQCLQETLRIRFPHLRSFIKFFDFTGGAEGSAAAGVRTLKASRRQESQTASCCS